MERTFSRRDHFASTIPKRHESLATLLLLISMHQLQPVSGSQLRLTSCICHIKKEAAVLQKCMIRPMQVPGQRLQHSWCRNCVQMLGQRELCIFYHFPHFYLQTPLKGYFRFLAFHNFFSLSYICKRSRHPDLPNI